jgi:hypothetical protein
VSRHDLEVVFFLESGAKKGKPIDVIPMSVGQEEVSGAHLIAHQLMPERTYPRARVQDYAGLARDHF